jgi:membrane peptidoglycan carboxypeptidase
MRLGRRVTDIVARFGITPPVAPSLVPIGGVYTSPLKLTQAYAAIKNNGLLPQVQFLIAAIGPKGNILGLPRRVEERRVMSSATARAVLQDLRGPVRRGTGHLANSVHALVYGKTGTSSRIMDALFVGLTEDYVGSFWLGYDRPRPMPGIVGGGTPAKAFSELTDYYYVKLAQNRYIESRHEFTDPLKRWKRLADETQFMKVAAVFGTILLTYLAVGNLRRRRRGVVASSTFVTSVPQVPAPLFEAGQGAPER